MITAAEIKKKAERKYQDYLRGIVARVPFEPIIIICDKKPSATIAEYEKELKNIRSLSKEVKGFGYTLEWKKVNSKALGLQEFPDRVLFDSSEDFERFLGKTNEVYCFRNNTSKILAAFPTLKCWIEKYPMKVVDNADLWDDLLKVATFFAENPCPNLYIRELPIEVHTKFIERNKPIIRELLDVIIAPYVCVEEKDFEKRFNLKYSESIVRMRILDSDVASSCFNGVNDISIPISQFCNLSIPVSKVYVVENLVNFLTFPQISDSVVVWGKGYAVSAIKNSVMLKSSSLYYWGDFDAQGFEILSQFRGYFPQTQSFLMDKNTFETYFENDSGTHSNVSVELHLTAEEKSLYEYIKKNNLRLEQEKIPQSLVVKTINLQNIGLCSSIKNS